jgi:oxepin-CoA hydrolase/3-oxo-5,6-dehydrosuberyl-CoA semialdehyde dehydrogenase
MNETKIQFIQSDFIKRLEHLPAEQKGKWGLMNAQQMVEHVTSFFKISTGRLSFPLVTPVEHLPKLRAFLWSDGEFRENTKAPGNIIPAEPLPAYNANMSIAIQKLEKEIALFFDSFKNDVSKKVLHPVFGELNYEDWIQLHYKHLLHHAKQFNLV